MQLNKITLRKTFWNAMPGSRLKSQVGVTFVLLIPSTTIVGLSDCSHLKSSQQTKSTSKSNPRLELLREKSNQTTKGTM